MDMRPVGPCRVALARKPQKRVFSLPRGGAVTGFIVVAVVGFLFGLGIILLVCDTPTRNGDENRDSLT